AAHVVALAGGAEAGGGLDPRDVGELDGQKALLERARDVGAVAVEAGVVDGGGAAPGDLLGELDVLGVEAASRGPVHPRERADRAAARGQGDHDPGAESDG